MSKYKEFIFDRYSFEIESKELRLCYSFDDKVFFTEVMRFDFDFAAYDNDALDRAAQLLFFVAGVSYFKAYLAPKITVRAGQIDTKLARFLNQTYQRGLGEFFYVNNVDPNFNISFPVNSDKLNTLSIESRGLLVGIGGGKDSLLSVELLRDHQDITTWSVGHRSQLSPLIDVIELPHYFVERLWDRNLLDHNASGAYNGHVPISAILACAGVVTAVLSGKQDVIVSNESSSGEPNTTYNGVDINHQYSKSLSFEQDFQNILQASFSDSIRYYSLLRPLSEIRIAELFSNTGFEKYYHVFSSCNKAYTHDSDSMYWCCKCPKCAFVFLAFTPFIDRSKLERLFHGKNLLLDPSLDPVYRQLLGIEGDKPLECVGEIKESRAAMRLAQVIYPVLNKYKFDIPEDYDFRTLSKHAIPDEVANYIIPLIQAN